MATLEAESSESWTFSALTLANLRGVGDRGFRLAVDHFGSASAALRAPKALRAVVPRASVGQAAIAEARQRSHEQLRRARRDGLLTFSYGGPGYPPRLGALHDPPAVLWTRGDASWLAAPAGCAIVGSRRASSYGVRTANALGSGLSNAGIVVVSGMALGIDGAAHRGALDACGGTIAVLGSGVDVPTPASQRGLYRRILENGLVVSEFEPGTGAASHNFPRRNRIIAALSSSLVVVEAARRSGALITVDHALDLGLSIYAVPGPVDTARSRGTNALIADGAGVVLSPEGLVEALGGQRRAPSGTQANFPPGLTGSVPRSVWSLLEDGPLDVDSIAVRLGEPAPTILGALGLLELDGYIQSEPGARYVRSPSGRPHSSHRL